MEAKKSRSSKEIGFNNDKLLDHINRRIDYMVSQALERFIGACIKRDELASILAAGSFSIGSLTAESIVASVIKSGEVHADKLSGEFDNLVASTIECDGLVSATIESEDASIKRIVKPVRCGKLVADSVETNKINTSDALIGDLECGFAVISDIESKSIDTGRISSSSMLTRTIEAIEMRADGCIVSGGIGAKNINADTIATRLVSSISGNFNELHCRNIASDYMAATSIDAGNVDTLTLCENDVSTIAGVVSRISSLEDGIVTSERGNLKTIQVSDINHDDLSGLDTKSHSQYVQLKPDREAGQIIEGSLSARGLDAVELSAQSAIFLKSTTMESGTQPIPLPVIRAASEFKGRNPQIAMLGGKVVLSNSGTQSIIGEVKQSGRYISDVIVDSAGVVVVQSLPVDALSCIIEVKGESGEIIDFNVIYATSQMIRLSVGKLYAGSNVKVLFCEVK